MNNLTILNVKISQNTNGLYSLNDLHKSHLVPGGDGVMIVDPGKRPGSWLRTERAKRLIIALESTAHICAVETSEGRGDSGSFGNKHVLLAYAQYLSVDVEIAVQDVFIEKMEAKPMSQMELAQYSINKLLEQERVLAEQKQQIVNANSRIDSLEETVLHSPFRTGIRYEDDPRQKLLLPHEGATRERLKRTRTGLTQMGIGAGMMLDFTGNVTPDRPSQCKVINGRKVSYDGRVTTLGALTYYLTGRTRRPMGYWKFRGKLLADIRTEILTKR